MGFELPDGKTARNLQEQVKFLSEKLKDLYAAVNKIGIRVLVVDELPEEGEPATIYLVPAEDASQENIYNEYLWIEDEWELIGSTAIDLSDYMTLSTDQTVSGEKTFSTKQKFSNNGMQIGFGTLDYESAFRFDADIKPKTTNAYSLGNSTTAWKRLFLSNNGEGTCFLTTISTYYSLYTDINNNLNIALPSGTIAERIDLDGNFISMNGKNLGESSHKWKDLYLSGAVDLHNSSVSYGYTILENEYSNLEINFNGARKFAIFNNNGCECKNTFHPGNNNTYDLGKNGRAWRNLYLSGNITDGTNTVSVADLAALITYAKGQGWIS